MNCTIACRHHLPNSLPIDTIYRDRDGQMVSMKYGAKLTYWWGAKGHCGMDPKPVYSVPILGGHVCEYVTPDQVIG